MSAEAAIADATGAAVQALRPLSGGCVGEVYRATLEDGRNVVAKVDGGGEAKLDIEGYMLRYLAEHSALPVPEVYHSAPELLVMEHVDGDSTFSAKAERHAAELLAAAHDIRGDRHGLERDTLIGGLHQPNRPTGSWVEFFREHRLRYMAREAHRAGRLPSGTLDRVERLAERVHDHIGEPKHPSLLHGDVWTTNVLARGNAITAFIDPAVYYGHPEIELAFITLFNTFGKNFFARYEALRGIEAGFFEERRDLYNLYPLLVHVRLFGGGYVGSVESTLSRFGC